MHKLEYTHHNTKLIDIIKLPPSISSKHGFYKLKFNEWTPKTQPELSKLFYIDASVLAPKLDSYFLCDRYTRKDVLGLQFNLHITLNGYLRLDKSKYVANWFTALPSTYYLNFIDIVSDINLSDGFITKFDITDDTYKYVNIKKQEVDESV